METAGSNQLDAGNLVFERGDCGCLGIFLVSGRGGSARRDQFTVAAVWDCEPVACGGGTGGRDHDSDEDGKAALDLGDADSDVVAGDNHYDRELAKDF